MSRQLYIGMVSEFQSKQFRFLRYLTGERTGQIKTFPYRGGVEKEAGRSYNKVTPTSVLAIIPIGLPGQPQLEELKDA